MAQRKQGAVRPGGSRRLELEGDNACSLEEAHGFTGERHARLCDPLEADDRKSQRETTTRLWIFQRGEYGDGAITWRKQKTA